MALLSVEISAPKTGEKKSQKRHTEDKDSHRWLRVFEQLVEIAPLVSQTELVCVVDRESHPCSSCSICGGDGVLASIC